MSNNDNLQMAISLDVQDSLKNMSRFKNEMQELRKEFKGVKQTLESQDLAEFYSKAKSPIKEFLKDLDKVNKKIAQQREKQHEAKLYNPNALSKIQKELERLETSRKNIYLAARGNQAFVDEQKSLNAQYRQGVKEIQRQYTEQANLNALQREQTAILEQQKATQSIKAKISNAEYSEIAEMERDRQKAIDERFAKYKQETALIEQQLQYYKQLRESQAEEALLTFESPQEGKLKQLNDQLDVAREKFKQAFAEGDTSGLKQAKAEIVGLNKELQRQEKRTNKTSSAWKKLLGRIKNISIYRTIRSVIKWFASGINDGVKSLVQFDDGFNKTFTNINASLNQVRMTFAVGWASTLQALEPTITALADGLTDLVNSFNLAMAKMSGKDTYVKAKKNAKDYADEVNNVKNALADFDKFRVLDDSDQIDPTELFEEGKVEEDANNVSDIMFGLLTTIKEVGGAIKEIIASVIDSGALQVILDIVGGIAKAIASVFTWLNKVGALKGIIIGLTTAFIAYKAATFLAAAGQAAVWVTAHPLLTGVMVAAVAVIAGIASSLKQLAGATSNITSGGGYSMLAEGGFTTANFIATNENGIKEWVGSNGNATAVVNDTQMNDIMYQAVKDGCYDGIIDALSDTESVGGQTTSTASVQVQGETIFTIVKDVAARQGLKFSKV